MELHWFNNEHDTLRLSFLDARGPGTPLIALHAHVSDVDNEQTFTAEARCFLPEVTVSS
jgi:hypothetical protein